MYPQNPKKTINRILERANPFYHLFAYYNDTLNNDSTAYKEKCKIIAEIWKNISKDYSRHKIQDIVHVMEWGKHHTFDVVLDGQWNHQKECFEEILLLHLKECEQGLVKIHKQFHFHFQGLIKVIQQPWDNEVLRGILQNSEKNQLTQKEIAYFANESGYATSMRIKKLVDDQCEDFAINLCSSYLKCLKLFEEGKVTLAVTEDQKKYAFDIYVALLYKVKRMDTMVGLLKALSDKEAKELVGRFSSKNAVNCKVWKSSYKVTFFSAMVFLHRHAQLQSIEDQETVRQIMKSWVKVIDSTKMMRDALKALKSLMLTQDTTSVFIYTIIEGLKSIDSVFQKVKHTRIELYIRALNKDLNRLETLRVINEEKLASEVSKELSNGLLKLAEELDDHLTVARECVLTAFSLNPTKVIFELIEKMAAKCGLNVLDTGQWECKFHAPVSPGVGTIECQTCNKYMKAIGLQAFNTNTILSEALTVENVGLPQELCDDLVIVLCSPRYQLLSWLQEWEALHRLCIMYLDNPDKTKNYITDLKFVEIDYSLFQKAKREPQEVGLGYDKVLEESGPVESGEEDLEIQFKRKKKPKKRVIRDSSDEEEVSEAIERAEVVTIQEKEIIPMVKASRIQKTAIETIQETVVATIQDAVGGQIKFNPTITKSLRSFRKRKADEICSTSVPAKVKIVEADVVTTPLSDMLDWGHNMFANAQQIHQDVSTRYLSSAPYQLPYHERNSEEQNYGINGVEVLDLSKSNNNNRYVGTTTVVDFDPFQEINMILQNHCTAASGTVPDETIEEIINMPSEENIKTKDMSGKMKSGVKILASQNIYPPVPIEDIACSGRFIRALASNVIIRRVNTNSVCLALHQSPKKCLAGQEHTKEMTSQAIMPPQNLIPSTLNPDHPIQIIELSPMASKSDLIKTESKVVRTHSSLITTETKVIAAESSVITTESGVTTVKSNLIPTESSVLQKEEIILETVLIKVANEGMTSKKGDIEIAEIVDDNPRNSNAVLVKVANDNTNSEGGDIEIIEIVDESAIKPTGNDVEIIKLKGEIPKRPLKTVEKVNLKDEFLKQSTIKEGIEMIKLKDEISNLPTILEDIEMIKIEDEEISEVSKQLIIKEDTEIGNLKDGISKQSIILEGIEMIKLKDELPIVEQDIEVIKLKSESPKKQILEDVTKITKDNIDLSIIEDVIGQKIVRKVKPVIVRRKSKSDSYLELLLNQPRYRRLQKPTKYDDYLYDFPEYRRKKPDKQVDTNKNEIIQDVGNEQDDERRSETSPNILKSDNYHSGQKYALYQDPDIREQTNQEKSLFREKGTEGFYSEETGKVAKKPHRDSNENKENSGYISKRSIRGKLKKKPKKHHRVSKSEEKEFESDQEYIRTDTGVYDRLLRDVKVVIDRIKLPSGKVSFSLSTDPEVFKRCEQLNRKLPRRPFGDRNQRVIANWRCRNPEYSNANINPKVILRPYDQIGKDLLTKYVKSTTGNARHFNNNRKNSNDNNNRGNHGNLRNTSNSGRNTTRSNNNAKNVLANVPGMKDTELIQPPPIANVVQVVQMTGRSSNSSLTTQTSTQVTPHIQRIGQPRQDKPETSNETVATTSGKMTPNAKPATTQSSLINILSHPVIRTSPGTTSTGRTPPVINILSNQIIRPATSSRVSTTTRTITTATTTMLSQSNNNMTRPSGESELVNQLTNPSRSSTTTGGTPSIKVASSESPSRIVQFICQSSDGKLIPVSSFAQNCVVKVASSQNVSPTSPNYEENLPKAIKNKSSDASIDSDSPETLPKFQQAFGKSVYQSKSTGTNSTNITNNVINHEVEKPKITVVQKSIVTTTTTTTSVKPIPGGVIYTRQVQSGQTINLIPQSRGQVFRIAASNSDQISVVKDTLIQNKMNALLAAALSKKDSDDSESEKQDEATSSSTTATTRVAIARPGLVQNARIVKPLLQIPSNVIRNSPQNMSSTTLEQLREFDMVYKQVKERSSTTPASEVSTNSETSESQCISVTYLNQGQKINCAPIVVVSSYNTIQPASSPALNVVSQGNTSPRVTPSPSQTSTIPKVTPKTSKGKTVKTPAMQNTSKASPIPKPQQKPQEDEHTTQRIFDILAEYAEQLRNSPDLNNKPAPRRRSNPPTNPSQNSKRKKSSSSKKPSQNNLALPSEPDTEDPRTLGSEDSSCGVMQLSVPDDEQPTTLASTSESNDSTSTPRQQLILTDSSNQPRNLIIAESSVGEALKMPNTAVLVPGNYIMPVSMVKGGQQIAVVSGGSKILATVPARSGPNMLLFQSFLNQNRKTSVPTVKYSTIQPISGISSQSLAGVTAQPPVILPPLTHSISTVTLGQPITVKKLDNSGQVNTELLLTISRSRENDSSEDTPQPDSSTNVVPASIEAVEIDEAGTLSDNSSEKSYTPYQKPLITAPIATPVIAQTSTVNTTTTPSKEEVLSEQSTTQAVVTLNITPIEQKGEQCKTEERIQTVLVTTSNSNSSMITQTRTNFKDSARVTVTQQNKDDFLRNSDKRNNEPKNLQTNNVYPQQGKMKKVQVATQRLDRELQQLCLQRKQAALERELRLQKSLSEECEDLGVDEPSTSDLFPEAELLFDSNHSPSFEQTSDMTKRIIVQQEGGKEEAKLTLFSDDDFLFEAGEYQKTESTAEYDGRTNGQSTEAGSPCEDATLLRTCTSMSDVTLNSPISPDTFHPTTPPPLHKYVHKYSNKKKSDKTTKPTENWTGEVSSSEDTTGSNEVKSSSPEICLSKVSEEELADGSFKVVRVAIAKRECDDCSDEGDCSLSGRGARRSVKKLCSCCNGASSQDSRKRPAQPHQHVPVPQKKVFPVKKR